MAATIKMFSKMVYLAILKMFHIVMTLIKIGILKFLGVWLMSLYEIDESQLPWNDPHFNWYSYCFLHLPSIAAVWYRPLCLGDLFDENIEQLYVAVLGTSVLPFLLLILQAKPRCR